ncbi:MAG: DUF3142 domain-containing protein [Proteobacteria bacterium]|nr:DUF3142 domain-containing protein [Pseudomonadota bacterium]
MVAALFAVLAVAWEPPPYESYWLWAGVPDSRLPGRGAVSVHVGAVAWHGETLWFQAEGAGPRAFPGRSVTVVFRLNGLPPAHELVPLLEAQARRFEAVGNRVAGVQLDYDAPTARLLRYRDTLGEVRAGLDPRWRLSITGLLDWVATGDEHALARVAASVDEIVFQLYQGRDYVAELPHYVARFSRLPFPFAVGLLADHPKNAELLERLRRERRLVGVHYFLRSSAGPDREDI